LDRSLKMEQVLGDKGVEDDDEDKDEEESQYRKNCLAMLGSIMEVKTAFFESEQSLQVIRLKMAEWLEGGHKARMNIALHLACEVVEKLKVASVPLWQTFMPHVFRCVNCKDPDLMCVAAYCINVASPIPQFVELAKNAFLSLAEICKGKPPKKRQHKMKLAFDNVVAALLNLAKNQIRYCPPEVEAFTLALNHLPLTTDEPESKKVNLSIVDMLLAERPDLTGGNNLPRVLGFLADIYNREDICEKTTNEKIAHVFKNLDITVIKNCAPNLTHRQQKKIEKILCPGPVTGA